MVVEILKNQTQHRKKILLIKPNYRTIGWDYYNMEFPPIYQTYKANHLIDLDADVEILIQK